MKWVKISVPPMLGPSLALRGWNVALHMPGSWYERLKLRLIETHETKTRLIHTLICVEILMLHLDNQLANYHWRLMSAEKIHFFKKNPNFKFLGICVPGTLLGIWSSDNIAVHHFDKSSNSKQLINGWVYCGSGSCGAQGCCLRGRCRDWGCERVV